MMHIPPRNYDDIINLPRPESCRRPALPLGGRAAQFAPFAALVGLEDELDDTAHRVMLGPDGVFEDSCGQVAERVYRCEQPFCSMELDFHVLAASLAEGDAPAAWVWGAGSIVVSCHGRLAS